MHRPRKERTSRSTQAKPLPAEQLNRSGLPPAADQVAEDEQEAALVGNASEPSCCHCRLSSQPKTAKLYGVGNPSSKPKASRGSASTSGKAAA
jgi:hypothetical protein